VSGFADDTQGTAANTNKSAQSKVIRWEAGCRRGAIVYAHQAVFVALRLDGHGCAMVHERGQQGFHARTTLGAHSPFSLMCGLLLGDHYAYSWLPALLWYCCASETSSGLT
jgi:hypothetical protein